MSETVERPPAIDSFISETRVIFRRFITGDRQVIALMPDTAADRFSSCKSFMHVGRFARDNYTMTMNQTDAVDHRDQDVVDLVSEMTGMGYRLKVVLRFPRPS